MMQDHFKEKISELRIYFSNHEDIATVYLFGSYGTELYDPERSDIDLAILYKGKASSLFTFHANGGHNG